MRGKEHVDGLKAALEAFINAEVHAGATPIEARERVRARVQSAYAKLRRRRGPAGDTGRQLTAAASVARRRGDR